MKLRKSAKQQGISYRTALRWWEAGLPQGYQSPTGTIVVTEEPPKEALVVHRVAIYARVSSAIASGKPGTTGGADDQLLHREGL